jgi:putative thioredoxin
MSAAHEVIRDVDTAAWEQAVIAESFKRPVVVDFWAAWCGPCRTLGPMLERTIAAQNGAVLLAKVDVDANQQLAARFRVQGIPAVKAFRDGNVVAEFTGALPEREVRRWLQQLLPSAAEGLVREAERLASGDPEGAIARYRMALAEDGGNAAALRGLVRLLLPRDPQAAEAELRGAPDGSPAAAFARQLYDLVPFYEQASWATPFDAAKSNASAEERYRWAASFASDEQWAEAFDQLLLVVARDRAYANDGARKALLALFALLGDDAPLVGQYRKRLASALF